MIRNKSTGFKVYFSASAFSINRCPSLILMEHSDRLYFSNIFRTFYNLNIFVGFDLNNLTNYKITKQLTVNRGI